MDFEQSRFGPNIDAHSNLATDTRYLPFDQIFRFWQRSCWWNHRCYRSRAPVTSHDPWPKDAAIETRSDCHM